LGKKSLAIAADQGGQDLAFWIVGLQQDLAQQIDMRRQAGLPPFGRLAGLILSSPAAPALHDAGAALARAVPADRDIQVLGPSDAPLARLRGRFRTRFLVQAKRGTEIQRFIGDWLGKVKLPSSVRLGIDIDPYSFY
ncbi:MAG: hypothetical protein AAFW76_05825, partial [Pseudomonadota bacterium]